MNKTLFYISIILTLFSCKNNASFDNTETHKKGNIQEEKLSLIDSSDYKQLLIDIIDKNLMCKVDIPTFLDSLTKQENIKVLETFTERYNEEKDVIIYNSVNREYKIKIIETDSTSNTLFYDKNIVIDFSKHKVLTNNNSEYKTEDFGFNFRNRLDNLKIIEIAQKQFLYADIVFDCNGKGCGCQLNFIYDINKKKAFFIDNFRFPYDHYFISDFNNDKTIDLIVIGRNKESIIKGLPIQSLSYQVTWFEYRDNRFQSKKGTNNDTISYEFISYSKDWDYPETSYSLLKNE